MKKNQIKLVLKSLNIRVSQKEKVRFQKNYQRTFLIKPRTPC